MRCLREERHVVRRGGTQELDVAISRCAAPHRRLHEATGTVTRDHDGAAGDARLEVEGAVERGASVVVGAWGVHHDDMPVLSLASRIHQRTADIAGLLHVDSVHHNAAADHCHGAVVLATDRAVAGRILEAEHWRDGPNSWSGVLTTRRHETSLWIRRALSVATACSLANRAIRHW